MAFKKTSLPGVIIFEPAVYPDERGFFFESYNKQLFLSNNISNEFVQDNQSYSVYGVIRGLHYQKDPYAQSKLVRVLHGEILDVVLDLRIGSPGFGKTYDVRLSAENKKQIFVPKGFAHGFSVLSETAVISYKCDEFYNKQSEAGIRFNDTVLNINWLIPPDKTLISEKDTHMPAFDPSISDFTY
jgi:dTDP-4-dehydrorhamnose 3,5-epimerase